MSDAELEMEVDENEVAEDLPGFLDESDDESYSSETNSSVSELSVNKDPFALDAYAAFGAHQEEPIPYPDQEEQHYQLAPLDLSVRNRPVLHLDPGTDGSNVPHGYYPASIIYRNFPHNLFPENARYLPGSIAFGGFPFGSRVSDEQEDNERHHNYLDFLRVVRHQAMEHWKMFQQIAILSVTHQKQCLIRTMDDVPGCYDYEAWQTSQTMVEKRETYYFKRKEKMNLSDR